MMVRATHRPTAWRMHTLPTALNAPSHKRGEHETGQGPSCACLLCASMEKECTSPPGKRQGTERATVMGVGKRGSLSVEHTSGTSCVHIGAPLIGIYGLRNVLVATLATKARHDAKNTSERALKYQERRPSHKLMERATKHDAHATPRAEAENRAVIPNAPWKSYDQCSKLVWDTRVDRRRRTTGASGG